MGDVILSVRGLSGGYGGRAVFSGVGFEACGGEIIAVIGPNGGGKTTLLKTLSGQLQPMGGGVELMGESVFSMKPNKRAKLISLLLTERIAAPMTSCRQVVAMGRYPYTGRLGILSPEDEAVVDETMERLFISGLKVVPFDRISDGQRQRVLIARALCQRPAVLIMDEPATYLDIKYRLELVEILKSLARLGLLIIVSMHELSMVKRCAKRVLAVHDGGAVIYDSTEELFDGNNIRRIFDIPEGMDV